MTRFFAHAFGEQGLTNGVVHFVCACVVQIFAFEPNLCAAEFFRQPCRVVNGAGATDIVCQITMKFCPKFGVLFGFGVGLREFLQGGDKGFGNVHAAVFAEKALFIRGLISV